MGLVGKNNGKLLKNSRKQAAGPFGWNFPNILPDNALLLIIYTVNPYPMKQCQLVKKIKSPIKELNLGINRHSEMNPGINGMDKAIF